MSTPLNQDFNTAPDTSNTASKTPDQIDLTLTEQQEAELKKKLEELRKRDPFIYR
jgi:hypothetical protein